MSLLKRQADRDDDASTDKQDGTRPGLRSAPAGAAGAGAANPNTTGAFPGGSIAPGADLSPPAEASPNANVNPTQASGTQARKGVDYTGGIDLTQATIAAQTLAQPTGAGGTWRLDRNQLKNMQSSTSVPQPADTFNWNQSYPTRDAAIQAYISAVRSGQGTAVAIDSSTNEPDASAGKVANPDDPSQAKNPAA